MDQRAANAASNYRLTVERARSDLAPAYDKIGPTPQLLLTILINNFGRFMPRLTMANIIYGEALAEHRKETIGVHVCALRKVVKHYDYDIQGQRCRGSRLVKVEAA